MKRYDLPEDGYRRKFCTCKPAEGESPDMFIVRIVTYLDRWIELSKTDASDRGLGAALMQENEGTLFPVAYASKKLTDRERKYSVTEREALAIVWGVKKFSLYLYGTVFTLQTDHGALQFLNAAKFDSPRIMKWALSLQEYNFDVQYSKGCENVGADYLSRIE
ncbi:Zinc finger protein [Plakobranchus ocellatus]|uniref:Zinc finger protein n=1 Tax=Plakobranchus ocellatus TaxID=259542 RepID=A0AAV4B3K3_9GAST|nr:Zinc finger protein [Plakobranchus ocellatus]